MKNSNYHHNYTFGMIVATLLIALLATTSLTPSVSAHGDKKHDDNGADNNAGAEVSDIPDTTGETDYQIARLARFQSDLNQLYASIGETYSTVKPMLTNSCYDCHSSKTNYPWYYQLPLIKGFLDGHISEATEHLDMTNGFPFGGHASQLSQLSEIKEVIEDDEMPLFSYRIMHWGKLIEGAKRDTLFAWISQSENSILSIYHGFAMPLPEDMREEEGESADDNGDNDNDEDHD